MKKCCISLGVNSQSPANHPAPIFQDFSRGLERIKTDLKSLGFDGDVIVWDQCYPKGCPEQKEAHGAFKPFCFNEAYAQGYDIILWMDASIKILSSINLLFNLIEKDGYLIFREDHSIGEYCKDEALATLGLTREESFNLPCCWSCVLGLDLRKATSQAFLHEWTQKALDGISFPGPKWSGILGWPKIASDDERVKGHRHDQTVASAIALKLNMNKWHSKSFFNMFFRNERDFVRSYQESKI